MTFIQQIALALADELRQRYPLDEIQAAPSFGYIAGALNPNDDWDKISQYNLIAIRSGKAIFSISISESEASVSIHEDEPDYQKFDKIDGLPGVVVNMMLSKQSKATRFILADPKCIENVLAVLDSAYPQERGNADAKMDGAV